MPSYEEAIEYTYFDPADVVTVQDSEYNVIAYGVPVDLVEGEPEAPEGAEVIPVQVQPPRPAPPAAPGGGFQEVGTPLPKPHHETDNEGCLGCDWNALWDRVRKAEGCE